MVDRCWMLGPNLGRKATTIVSSSFQRCKAGHDSNFQCLHVVLEIGKSEQHYRAGPIPHFVHPYLTDKGPCSCQDTRNYNRQSTLSHHGTLTRIMIICILSKLPSETARSKYWHAELSTSSEPSASATMASTLAMLELLVGCPGL